MVDKGAGFSWGADVVSFGALVAITSVVLTILYGQTRIVFSMCRDGLVPRGFAKLSARRRTPVRITAVFHLVAVRALAPRRAGHLLRLRPHALGAPAGREAS